MSTFERRAEVGEKELSGTVARPVIVRAADDLSARDYCAENQKLLNVVSTPGAQPIDRVWVSYSVDSGDIA